MKAAPNLLSLRFKTGVRTFMRKCCINIWAPDFERLFKMLIFNNRGEASSQKTHIE